MTQPAPAEDQRDRSPSAGGLPQPDPTVMTTQLVDRALAAYREVVETRLAGMDRAILLAASELAKVAGDVDLQRSHTRDDFDRQVAALREFLLGRVDNVAGISLEKFAAVDIRFTERDTRTEQEKLESRISLDAALAAAKEAVSEQNKSNTEAIRVAGLTTQKQIDSIQALMTTSLKALEDRIVDLKERLDLGQGVNRGTTEARTEQRLNIGQVLVAVAVVIAAIGLIVTIVASRGV